MPQFLYNELERANTLSMTAVVRFSLLLFFQCMVVL